MGAFPFFTLVPSASCSRTNDDVTATSCDSTTTTTFDGGAGTNSAYPSAHDAAGLVDPLLLNLWEGIGSRRALIRVFLMHTWSFELAQA